MHIYKVPFAISMAVAVGGALWASLAEWSTAGVYGVCFAAVVVYFVGVYWIESRPGWRDAGDRDGRPRVEDSG